MVSPTSTRDLYAQALGRMIVKLFATYQYLTASQAINATRKNLSLEPDISFKRYFNMELQL